MLRAGALRRVSPGVQSSKGCFTGMGCKTRKLRCVMLIAALTGGAAVCCGQAQAAGKAAPE